jgi:hypothetical protein
MTFPSFINVYLRSSYVTARFHGDNWSMPIANFVSQAAVPRSDIRVSAVTARDLTRPCGETCCKLTTVGIFKNPRSYCRTTNYSMFFRAMASGNDPIRLSCEFAKTPSSNRLIRTPCRPLLINGYVYGYMYMRTYVYVSGFTKLWNSEASFI